MSINNFQNIMVKAAILISLMVSVVGVTVDGAASRLKQAENIAEASFTGVYEAEEEAGREPLYSEKDIELLAKTVYGEARGCSREEQKLVIWTVFQRVGDTRFGDTLESVITAPAQFSGYRAKNPVDPRIYELCVEEINKWVNGEQAPTLEPYAMTAPYYYFDGDGVNNWFSEYLR